MKEKCSKIELIYCNNFFTANKCSLCFYLSITLKSINCYKGKDGFSAEPMSDIVNRCQHSQQVYLAGDKATLVAYQISGLTLKILKIQNLVSTIDCGSFFSIPYGSTSFA